jgi:hypothetical protein
MGMFDSLRLYLKCPFCDIDLKYFQSKELDCELNTYDIFSKEFKNIDNFYIPCESGCEHWIEFHRSEEDKNCFMLDTWNHTSSNHIKPNYTSITVKQLKINHRLKNI